MSSSEDKDKLILTLFEELKKTRESLDKANEKIEELSKVKVEPSHPISLSQLQQAATQHELSSTARDKVSVAVELLLKYAKNIGFT